MVKTKQTAKKTTGGTAKRGELPQFKKVASNAGTQVIKTVFPRVSLPHVKPKPSTHNIVCIYSSPCSSCSSQMLISIVFFAGMAVTCMTASTAHVRYATAALLLRRNHRTASSPWMSVSYAQGAMKCVESVTAMVNI